MRDLRISRAGIAWHAAALRRRTRDAVSRARSRLPTQGIALTFDDGPQPGSTDRLLDILGELGAPATFFCVGKNVLRHPDLVGRMLTEGHAVGSHSFSHPHPLEIPLGALTTEYRRGRDVVAAAGGTGRLFRPPHGAITFAGAGMMRGLHLQPWLWSVDPEDWQPGVSAAHIRTVAGRALAGDVVLLHDWVEQPVAPAALDRSATVTALRPLIEDARDRGLVFERLEVRRSHSPGSTAQP